MADCINKISFPAAADITIAEAQRVVDRWIRTVGVRYFAPLTNMAVLTEEVGEVARVMARRYGEQSCKNSDDASAEKLADELADVLWVLLAIANQTDTDLTAALRRNLDKKTTRDAQRHRNNPALQDVNSSEPHPNNDNNLQTT